MAADVEVVNDGSVLTFRPVSDAAKAWVTDNLELAAWQWLGDVFVVEARYADHLADGMKLCGLTVEVQ